MKLPEKVTVIEVGPRDGFQNVKDFIATEDKIRIIELLRNAGVTAVEVTSFVHPKAVPQMADAKEVAEKVREKFPDLRAIALVPNERGAKNAWECGIKEVSYVISASEAHNQANVRRTVKESLEELGKIRQAVPELKVRLDIATAFGCPYAGKISQEQVFALMEEAKDFGIQEIVLCDTIGIADPVRVAGLAEAVKKRYPEFIYTMHLHNTRGQGLANILAAMQNGITSFETSVGGLGGCPFAPGAAGNAATEDFLNMLDYMGVESGIAGEEYLKAVAYVKAKVHADLTGNMLRACKYDHI
ncbi:hydroxymethylglutaryl-CoA lyase [Lachnospiraceae bacterium KGMB03038]|nr:hydroxymethylglutaryl-CoA lyase [Lachnospiraceae bacterium KGMB03038]